MAKTKRRRRAIPSKQRAAAQTTTEFFFQGTTRDPLRRRDKLTQPLAQHAWMSAAMRVVTQNAVKATLQFWPGEAGKGKPIPEEDPRVKVWRKPNGMMGGAQLIEAIFTWIWEVGYVGLVKVGSAQAGRLARANEAPRELWALPGPAFEMIPDKATNMPLAWKVHVEGREDMVLQPWEVLWIRRFNPYSPWTGLGMWQAAMQAANQDFKAAAFMDGFLANDAQMGGVLKLAGRSTETQRQQLKQTLDDRHKGADNAGKTQVLGKDMEWIPNQFPPRDMQYQELRTWDREEVLGVGGVPPILVGVITDYNLATAKAAMTTFLNNTLIPACSFVAREITADMQAKWAGSEKVTAAFDFSAFPELSEVTAESVTSAKTLFDMAVPFNQISERLRLGIKPTESGDTEFLPTGMVPAELLINPPEPDPEQAPSSKPGQDDEDEDPKKPVDPEEDPDEDDDAEEKAARDAARAVGTPAETRAMALAAREKLGMARASVLPKWHLYVALVLEPIELALASKVRRHFWNLRSHLIQLTKDAFEAMQTPVRAFVMRADGEDEKQKRRLSRSLIDRLLFNEAEWAAKLQAIIAPAHEDAAKKSLAYIKDELPKGAAVLNVGDPKVSRFLAEKDILVKRITEGVRERLRRVLVDSVIEANTIAEAQTEVLKIMKHQAGNAISRSLTIARTETAGAANGVRQLELEEQAAKPESRIRRQKWVTAGDSHVREAHMAVDGEIVEIGTPFKNGLLYPGEAGAPPEQVIACRCVATAVIDK